MNLTEKQLSAEYKYKGRIINMRFDTAELPDGNICSREVVEHNGGVCVAALTDNNELLFVRQFRYPYMEVILELPAGKLEKGEDPFEAGKRELEEETGNVAEKYAEHIISRIIAIMSAVIPLPIKNIPPVHVKCLKAQYSNIIVYII